MVAGDQAAMERWAGLALAASAILALIFANSGLSGVYSAILGFPIPVAIGDFAIAKPLRLWVNDGLMAIFFLLVGLEIKREFLAGELSDWRRAVLPLIAACGGFAVPALLFVALNSGSPQNITAWAVPTATDIAFVVGLIAALGRLVPFSLKVFVLAIAIIDDLMAVVVIAVFYTAKLSLPMLGLAMVCLAILVAFNRLGVRRIAAYMLVGIVMWALVLKSGVHATLAGVAMGFVVPLLMKSAATPLEDLEHGLKPWVSFLIVASGLWRGRALRHRLHDEPLHRLALLQRSRLAGPHAPGRDRGIARQRDLRRAGAVDRREARACRPLTLCLEADGTGNARAAEPAIAVRVLRQILLVIFFCEVERPGGRDLGRDVRVSRRLQPSLIRLARGFRLGELRLAGGEDRRAILRADIVALPHALRRIVILPEDAQEIGEAHLRGVIDHAHHFRMARAAGASLLVGGVGREATGVTRRRAPDAFADLPELALGTPEAAHAEHGLLEALGDRAIQWPAKHPMRCGRGNGLRAARQRLIGARKRHGFAGEEHGNLQKGRG